MSSATAEGPLHGKVAIVTGAATGIGLAICHALARQGAALSAVYRSEGGELSIRSDLGQHGPRVVPVRADLADRAEVASVVPRTLEEFGQIDILVNNAAATHVQQFLEQSDEEWDEVFDVNLRAPFVLIREVARVMIGQGTRGRIVNLSSSSAFRAVLSPVAYSTSKAAIGALTRSAAGALGRHGILVNAVAPGITATPTTTRAWGEGFESSGIAEEGPLANLIGRVAMPADIADVVAFLCLHESRNITGQTIHASGGAVV